MELASRFAHRTYNLDPKIVWLCVSSVTSPGSPATFLNVIRTTFDVYMLGSSTLFGPLVLYTLVLELYVPEPLVLFLVLASLLVLAQVSLPAAYHF